MVIFLTFFFYLYHIEFNNRQIKMPALLCLLEKCTSFLCICFRLAASDKVNKSMQLKQKHWTIFEGMRFGVISICVCTKMAAGLLTLGALNFIRFVTEQPKISVGKCNQSSASTPLWRTPAGTMDTKLQLALQIERFGINYKPWQRNHLQFKQRMNNL